MAWILSCNQYPLEVLSGDAADFYAPLKSVFISQDFTSQQSASNLVLHGRDGTYNVHTVGLAILWLPFFLTAYVLSKITGMPADGVSFWFQWSTLAAASLALWTGFVALYKLFKLWNTSAVTLHLVCVGLLAATNLAYYTWAEPGMSHVYAFALIAWFLYFSYQLASKQNSSVVQKWFILWGLLVLLRPFHVIWGIAPFFWNYNGRFYKTQFLNTSALKGFLYFLGIVSIQAWVWLGLTGCVYKDTYPADGFYFSHPQVFKFLISPEAGWLFYTPFAGVCLIGWFRGVFYKTHANVIALIFIAVSVYVLSSFWAYNYFDGWGIRIMVDYLPLLAIGGVYVCEAASVRIKNVRLGWAMLTPMVLWTGLFTYQAQAGIMPRTGMTWNQFKYLFGKTDAAYANCLGGWHEPTPYASKTPLPLSEQHLQHVSLVTKNNWEYTPALSHRLTASTNRLFVKFCLKRHEIKAGSSTKAMLCIIIKRPGQDNPLAYTQTLLNETPNDPLNAEYRYSQSVCGDFKTGDTVATYIWNPQKTNFSLSEFIVSFYSYAYDIS